MLSEKDSKYLMRIIAYVIALVGFGNFAYADGFDDKDFSLRFPAALSRFPHTMTLPPLEELLPAASGSHPSIQRR